jgi:hypothetical protein
MEGSRGKLSESGQGAVKARVEAALSEARQRRARGDLHGARELALSILAIGEEHIDARQLMAAVELAALPRPQRPTASVPEHEHEAAPPPPPPPPAPTRPEVVILGAPPPGKTPAQLKRSASPRPLAELAGPLPWAPSEAPPDRPHHRRLTAAVGLVIAALVIVAAGAALLLRTPEPADTAATAPEAAPSPSLPAEPPAASVVPAPEPVVSVAPPPTTAAAADPQLALNEKARREVEDAQREVRDARAAAEQARAPELSAALFTQARLLDDEAVRLVRRQRWTFALERRRAATAAYRQAHDHARLEQGRLLVQDAKARAVAAGADRLSPDRLKEATAGITRAQVLREHGDVEAALKEYQSAATAAEQARRSALEAANTPPPTTAAPAPAPPARTPEMDRQEILGVVRRYAAAMEARDLGALKALWPAMGEAQAAKIRASFEFARELRVTFEVTSVHVEDRTATVLARRRDVIVTTDGQALNNERPATITLTRGEAWNIASIQ